MTLQEPEAKRPALPPPLPPPPISQQGVQIRKDYNPKVARPPVPQAPPSQQFLISPITGEKIPAEKMQEHMRYGQLQPRTCIFEIIIHVPGLHLGGGGGPRDFNPSKLNIAHCTHAP